MLPRGSSFLLLLVLAVGIPYGLFGSGAADWVKSKRPSAAQKPGSSAIATSLSDAQQDLLADVEQVRHRASQSLERASAAIEAARARVAAPPVESSISSPMLPMEQAFRFDLSPDWVMHQWPRVSAKLADLDLQGLRVPLVTGTREDDLAGSTSYYFGPEGTLERIVFLGNTGNGNKLATYAAAIHGLEKQASENPSLQLFQRRDGRRVASELRIWTSDVVDASQPNGRYHVALWLERPETTKRSKVGDLLSALGEWGR